MATSKQPRRVAKRTKRLRKPAALGPAARLLQEWHAVLDRLPAGRDIAPSLHATLEGAARIESLKRPLEKTVATKPPRSRRGLGEDPPGLAVINASKVIAARERRILVLEAAVAELKEFRRQKPNSELPSVDRLASILKTKVRDISHRSIRRYLAETKDN